MVKGFDILTDPSVTFSMQTNFICQNYGLWNIVSIKIFCRIKNNGDVPELLAEDGFIGAWFPLHDKCHDYGA